MKTVLTLVGELGAAGGWMMFAISDGFVAWTALVVSVLSLAVAVWAAEDDPDEPPDHSTA